jgi:anti-anti-sigma factor
MAGLDAELLTDDGSSPVVAIRGELDIATVGRLEAVLAPVLAKHPARLVLDVGALRFADSSGIALWVRCASRVDELELRDPSPLLRRVVTTMGLAGKLRLKP